MTTTSPSTSTTNQKLQPALQEIEFNLPQNHYDKIDWIDVTLRPIKLFADTYGINPIDDPNQVTSKYFSMSAEAHLELRKATTELHSMFAQATGHVLRNPHYWPNFGFPENFWPMASRSYDRGDKNLCGRFDFAISPEYGIKCYEYNTDSASCLIECAHTQDAWSVAMGLGNIGRDGGLGAAKRVTAAWSRLYPPGTLIHFFFDNTDREECVHVAYVIHLAEKAGLVCKEVSSVNGFTFSEGGADEEREGGLVIDAEGLVVQHIWKSWNYTTLLEILEKEGPIRTTGTVRLIDICFHEKISILEPVWSAIPANKAILPVLSELFPDSPYLLFSSFTLTDKLIKNGYCSKPVLGRGGQNISLHFPLSSSSPSSSSSNIPIDENDPNYVTPSSVAQDDDPNSGSAGAPAAPAALVVAPGNFSESPTVYQELATLPRFNGLYTQINTFAAYGKYAGTVIRVEPSAIVGYNSNVFVLRVVEDGTGTPLPNDELEF
jgi:glutathionylspermidine amidase/synthetase